MIKEASVSDAVLDRVYRQKADIVSRNIAGQTILVPIRGKVADMQRIFMLNSVAEFVWDQLSGENRVNQICHGVEENFTVTGSVARTDVCELIDRLIDLDLICEVR